jgi:hypothetical protein
MVKALFIYLHPSAACMQKTEDVWKASEQHDDGALAGHIKMKSTATASPCNFSLAAVLAHFYGPFAGECGR